MSGFLLTPTPEEIEHAHFGAGTGEVTAPHPYSENGNLVPGETYSFPMPPSPTPEWLKNIVATRRLALNQTQNAGRNPEATPRKIR